MYFLINLFIDLILFISDKGIIPKSDLVYQIYESIFISIIIEKNTSLAILFI